MLQLLATTITAICIIALASLAHAAPPAGAEVCTVSAYSGL